MRTKPNLRVNTSPELPRATGPQVALTPGGSHLFFKDDSQCVNLSWSRTVLGSGREKVAYVGRLKSPQDQDVKPVAVIRVKASGPIPPEIPRATYLDGLVFSPRSGLQKGAPTTPLQSPPRHALSGERVLGAVRAAHSCLSFALDDSVYYVTDLNNHGDGLDIACQLGGKLEPQGASAFGAYIIFKIMDYLTREGSLDKRVRAHLDIKPENLGCSNGVLRVEDIPTKPVPPYFTGAVAYTPGYASPELIHYLLSNDLILTARSDVWSAAVTAAVMVTGTPSPFDVDRRGLTPRKLLVATRHRHKLFEKWCENRAFRGATPHDEAIVQDICNFVTNFEQTAPALAGIVLDHMLVVDPRKRKTAKELWDVLRRVVNEDDIAKFLRSNLVDKTKEALAALEQRFLGVAQGSKSEDHVTYQMPTPPNLRRISTIG